MEPRLRPALGSLLTAARGPIGEESRHRPAVSLGKPCSSIERPQLAFGYACLGDPQMAEWGYIALDELAVVYRPPLLIVERDLHWSPRPAGEVIPYL